MSSLKGRSRCSEAAFRYTTMVHDAKSGASACGLQKLVSGGVRRRVREYRRAEGESVIQAVLEVAGVALFSSGSTPGSLSAARNHAAEECRDLID